ncbi:coiled-coil domain-containing protein 64 [Sarotherodon galilaeus]
MCAYIKSHRREIIAGIVCGYRWFIGGLWCRQHLAVAAGILYLKAEEEAAQLRRLIRERRARMKMREETCLDGLLDSVHSDLKPAFRLLRPSINMLVQMLTWEKQHGNMKLRRFDGRHLWHAGGNSVTEEMMTILHRVIHFPKAEEMEEETVPLCCAQGICDSKGTFLDVYIGNSGSVHDALVLRRSPIYKQALYPPAGIFLLGDGGYPCLKHPVAIMTPYRQPVSSQKHHRAILKTCWRSIFLRALEIQPLFAPKVVGACCILHNICLATDDVCQEEGEEEGVAQAGPEAETEGTGADRELSGTCIRTRLAAQLSAPEQLPASLFEHNYI